MTMCRENEVVVLRDTVSARIVSGGEIEVAEGATGTIVTIYGNPKNPLACEVEFFLADLGKFALATVDATQLRGWGARCAKN